MEIGVGGGSTVGLQFCRPFNSIFRSLPFPWAFTFSSKSCPSMSYSRPRCRRMVYGNKKSTVVRASSSSSSPSSSDSPASIAPLRLESPVGQFLSQMLMTHPHLVADAVDQQLQQLQTDRDADQEKKPQDASAAQATDLVLYRRIADVKANERRKVVEEILYALVVKKFMDANISLVPAIVPSSSERVDSWPSQEEELKQLHSPEACEMIQNHLALILGYNLGNTDAVTQISKLRVGQVYVASIMYGYFLRRVDQRFQFEKSMRILTGAVDEKGSDIKDSYEATPSDHPEVSSSGFGFAAKPSRLRTYVMSFDGETLQRYATIRSKEAVGMIEKHSEALFGNPEIVISPQGTIDSSTDEEIKISFGGLKRLVLEALTFGSFVWDVESYVDSRYHFVTN